MTDRTADAFTFPHFGVPPKPWPCDANRATWEAHRASMGPDSLPPYDEAGDELQGLWHHMERLTTQDIASAWDAILRKIDG